MTWDHRRAVDPLLATQAMFAQQHPGIEIEWSSRPLHGFEFTPVAELARSYDMIILDHPFCGDIAASNCLLPLDDVLAGDCDPRSSGLRSKPMSIREKPGRCRWTRHARSRCRGRI
jgi:multiple sugar transport system substrate-binding protein